MASSSKKPRMDQPTNVIDVTLTDFKKIATKFPNTLVDKTELIYIFCTVGNQHEVITAPPRFGKSVNLTMFRCFFEIEVDPATGRLKTQLDLKTEAITDTENYRLFADLNLTIMNYPDLVEKHFGRHPVLYVSFKCERSIKTVDVIELCRTVVHCSFKQHKYLCVSEKLTDEDRALCKGWCGDSHKKMDPRRDLLRLTQFLYKHFERDVVFLVDDYDSLVARALVEGDGNSVEDVCEEYGVDHRVACELFSGYDLWMEQITQKHDITPGLVSALINASPQTREEICSMNGVDVNVAQQLVDEYEQKVTESWSISNLSSDKASDLIRAHENRIEDAMWKKPVAMMAPLLKNDANNIHLLGSLVTGVSYIIYSYMAASGWSGIVNNITPCRFTQHHQFNQFYGFQSEEIEGLLEKLGKLPGFEVEKKKTLDIIKAQYNGYEYPGSTGNPGEKIYCPWSVLNYLKEGSPQSFWAGASYAEPLKHMFKNFYVRMFLLRLLEENGTSSLCIVNKLTADDLVKLKKYIKGISIQRSHELFLNFILELGYLTVDSTQPDIQTHYCVKVPNTEVKVMLLKRLKDYYKEKCSQEFKENAIMKSEEILNCINSAADPNVSDEECKKALRGFRQELQTLFQQYSDSCLPIVNESGLHCFMAEIITTGNFRYFTEHYVLGTDSNKDRLDVLGFGKQIAFLVQLKNFPTSRKSAVDALNQILDKEYFNAFEHPTLLASNLKRHILMGISVNEDKKMAISAIRNHKKGTDSHRINIPFDE